MSKPSEQKTVQAHILASAQEIGWSYGVTWNTVRQNIFVWNIDEPQRTQGTQREEEKGILKSKSFALSALFAVQKD